MALGEKQLPVAVSRIFSEQELEDCLALVREGKSAGDGPYESKQVTKTNRAGEKVKKDQGELEARGLVNNLRQHMMLRANGDYVESRGEGRRAGKTLRTKVWEDTDGWHFAVYEAEITSADEPVAEEENGA